MAMVNMVFFMVLLYSTIAGGIGMGIGYLIGKNSDRKDDVKEILRIMYYLQDKIEKEVKA